MKNASLPLSSREQVPGDFHGDGIDAGAGGGVEGFEVFATEGAVGGLLGEFDDAEQVALWVEDLDAEGGRDIDVALAVDGQAVAAAVGLAAGLLERAESALRADLAGALDGVSEHLGLLRGD